MTEDEVLGCADENYFESFRLFSKAATHGDQYEDDELLLTSTGTDVEWINIGFVKQGTSDSIWAVQHALEFYRRAGVPFVLRIREGVDTAAEQAAEALGLAYTDSVPGMVMEPIASAPTPAEGLEIGTVTSDHEFDAFVRIVAECFHLDLEAAASMLTPRLLEGPAMTCYLGRVDGQPVATSALLLTPRTGGVHIVAVAESHRRQGIGEAMTRHAINEGAAAGCEIAALQASEMGYPVYERIGFRRLCDYRTFHHADFPTT